jgi:branched-chain amino acid transport system substrate-binding protein
MKRMAGLIAALALAAAAAGCGESEESNTTPIAMVGPVTGQYASFGAQMQNGAELAVEDINAAGGVLGKKIELDIGDDACDPKQAVAVANQMTGKGVALIAGHYCSGSSIPASQVYAESDTVQISPASTNPALTDNRAGPNVYRVCGRDDQQGGVAGKYLAKNFADKNIAIIHDKTAYGKGLADETKKAANKLGATEAMYEGINKGDKDFTALYRSIKGFAAEIRFLPLDGRFPRALAYPELQAALEPAEREAMLAPLSKAETEADRQRALGDLLWALLNSVEFTFNH